MARILIIDDDTEVQEVISTCLEGEGHEVTSVTTVQAANESLAQRLPDLILLDLMLPDQDGLEYIKDLFGDERTKHLPVIVVSALKQKKKIIEGLKAGAIDYITKPFELVELKVRVNAALKIHDLKREQDQNKKLEAMRETARTVEYEIELPMHEIQRCLIQLRNEAVDFKEDDRKSLEEAWNHFATLEDILSRVQQTGI